MKKLLLLISASAFAMGANAQSASTMRNNPINPTINRASFKNALKHSNVAKKTTSATERWYSYVDYYDTSEIDNSSSIALSAPYLWNDTMSMDAYSGASGIVFEHNTTVHMGTILDPRFGSDMNTGFNNHNYYSGEMRITATDAYALDSILIFGRYGFNPTKTSVVDTIRISLAYGNGSSSSDIFRAGTTNSVVLTRYGLGSGDTLKYLNINYDSITNRPTGTTVQTINVLLDNTGASPAWGDTLSDGTYPILIGFPSISVPAGGYVSATFTFKTGDASFVPHDTVFSSTMGYKYNMFRPYVAYKGTSTAPAFAPYNVANGNTGVFKTLPNSDNGWTDLYIPQWFWSSGTSGSTLQYPYIDYHLTCTTCGTVYDNTSASNVITDNSVVAVPNPADNNLSIKFNLNASSDVKVTLTNVVGQEVAAQSVTNTKGGNVEFNTAALPAGIYMYTVSANGQRTTGRVVVAH